MFYDNSIFPGTKIALQNEFGADWFYDNSIFPGTKIPNCISQYTILYFSTEEICNNSFILYHIIVL